jgi:hypothetical protein
MIPTRLTEDSPRPRIYWHRDLPPLREEPAGEYIVEAESQPIPSGEASRRALWDQCHQNLIDHATDRLGQELSRLGGTSAHVVEADIREKRDPVAGTLKLLGRFTYVLYRAPAGG